MQRGRGFSNSNYRGNYDGNYSRERFAPRENRMDNDNWRGVGNESQTAGYKCANCQQYGHVKSNCKNPETVWKLITVSEWKEFEEFKKKQEQIKTDEKDKRRVNNLLEALNKHDELKVKNRKKNSKMSETSSEENKKSKRSRNVLSTTESSEEVKIKTTKKRKVKYESSEEYEDKKVSKKYSNKTPAKSKKLTPKKQKSKDNDEDDGGEESNMEIIVNKFVKFVNNKKQMSDNSYRHTKDIKVRINKMAVESGWTGVEKTEFLKKVAERVDCDCDEEKDDDELLIDVSRVIAKLDMIV